MASCSLFTHFLPLFVLTDLLLHRKLKVVLEVESGLLGLRCRNIVGIVKLGRLGLNLWRLLLLI